MAIKESAPFDVKSFLAKVGDGRSIGKYRKNQVVFSAKASGLQLINHAQKSDSHCA